MSLSGQTNRKLDKKRFKKGCFQAHLRAADPGHRCPVVLTAGQKTKAGVKATPWRRHVVLVQPIVPLANVMGRIYTPQSMSAAGPAGRRHADSARWLDASSGGWVLTAFVLQVLGQVGVRCIDAVQQREGDEVRAGR